MFSGCQDERRWDGGGRANYYGIHVSCVCACTRYRWRGTPDESCRPPTAERCSASPETERFYTRCHLGSCTDRQGKKIVSLFLWRGGEYSTHVLLTQWGPGWSPSCSPSRCWTCGRPRRGPAPAAPAPGWSPSGARCRRAAAWSAPAAPRASPNTRPRAAWPSESAPSGQPGKNRANSGRYAPRGADAGAFRSNAKFITTRIISVIRSE